jgi:hypothetical protein
MYYICLFWVYFIMMSFNKLSTLLSVGMHIVIPQSTTVRTGVKEDGVQRHWMVLKASYGKSHSANFTKSGIMIVSCWCLTPISTIVKIDRGGQLDWRWQSECTLRKLLTWPNLTAVLSVLLRYADSDYSIGIFKHFFVIDRQY